MKTFQYNIMKVKDAQGNYIEFPSIAQKDPITLKANLTTTASGYALDASQGYALDLKKVNKSGDIMTGNLTIQGTYYPAVVLTPTTAVDGIYSSASFECSYANGGVASLVVYSDRTTTNRRYLSLYGPTNDIGACLVLREHFASNDSWKSYMVLHTGNMNSYGFKYVQMVNNDLTSLTATSGGFGNASGTHTSSYYSYIPFLNKFGDNEAGYFEYSKGFRAAGRNALTYTDSTGATASTTGLITLYLGNDTSHSEPGGYSGCIRLYGSSTFYNTIYSSEVTATRTVYLPTPSSTATGAIYLAGAMTSSVAGSASRPVYVASGGIIKPCNLSVVCQASQPTSPHTGMIWLKPVS